MVWEDEVDRNDEVGRMVDEQLAGNVDLHAMLGCETVDTKAAIAALAEGRRVYGVTLRGGARVETIVDVRAEYGRGGPATFEVHFVDGYTRIVLAGATFWVEKPTA